MSRHPERNAAVRRPMPTGTAGLLATLPLFLVGAVTLGGGLAAASAVLAAVVAVLLILTLELGRTLVWVTVRGMSMSPTYTDGDRVLVRRRVAVRVGDVVVIERPDADLRWPARPVRPRAGQGDLEARAWMIKRVAAGPGDPIPRKEFAGLGQLPGEHTPDGMLILLGDNHDASFDSREIGFFPADRVLGIPLRRGA